MAILGETARHQRIPASFLDSNNDGNSPLLLRNSLNVVTTTATPQFPPLTGARKGVHTETDKVFLAQVHTQWRFWAYRLGQALGGIPLGFGIAVED